MNFFKEVVKSCYYNINTMKYINAKNSTLITEFEGAGIKVRLFEDGSLTITFNASTIHVQIKYYKQKDTLSFHFNELYSSSKFYFLKNYSTALTEDGYFNYSLTENPILEFDELLMITSIYRMVIERHESFMRKKFKFMGN